MKGGAGLGFFTRGAAARRGGGGGRSCGQATRGGEGAEGSLTTPAPQPGGCGGPKGVSAKGTPHGADKRSCQVVGFVPYERPGRELLRIGQDKRPRGGNCCWHRSRPQQNAADATNPPPHLWAADRLPSRVTTASRHGRTAPPRAAAPAPITQPSALRTGIPHAAAPPAPLHSPHFQPPAPPRGRQTPSQRGESKERMGAARPDAWAGSHIRSGRRCRRLGDCRVHRCCRCRTQNGERSFRRRSEIRRMRQRPDKRCDTSVAAAFASKQGVSCAL